MLNWCFALGLSLSNQDIISAHSHLQLLSHNEMAGRKAQTQQSALSAHYIANQFKQIGLVAFNNSFFSEFSFSSGFFKKGQGVNVLASSSVIPGKPYVVLTAHYDHIGTRGNKTFNGADDNASGVAALLVLAKNIEQMPNRQLNYLFLATDAEENGLHGARSFVEQPPIPLSDMIVNINLDMLGYSKRKRLLGLYTSQLKPLIEELKQLQWHRGGDVKFTRGNGFFPISVKSQRRRILNASDHKLFHQNAIPILYFGVGEHRFYHTEDDTYDNLHHQFYNANLHNIAKVISLLDANYSQIGTH